MQLTLSGVTNDIYCSNCDGYNKSWILDYQGYNSGSGGNSCWYCIWDNATCRLESL